MANNVARCLFPPVHFSRPLGSRPFEWLNLAFPYPIVAVAGKGSVDLAKGGNDNFDLFFLLNLGTAPCRRGDQRTIEDFATGEATVVPSVMVLLLS